MGLFTARLIYFIQSFSQFYQDIFAFMNDLYLRLGEYAFVLYIYIVCFVTEHHKRSVYRNGSLSINLIEIN